MSIFIVACLAFAAHDARSLEADILTDPSALPGQELAYAIAMDGVRIVAGSPGLDARAGIAHVFDCPVLPCPPPTALQPADLAMADLYGAAVTVDGDTVVVGAPGQLSGAVYVYVRAGGNWTRQARLTASDGNAGDAFGTALALDGHRLVIGASAANDHAGAAYVFVRSGTTWSQQARLTADDTVAGDRFGASVALDGNTILVGAPFDAAAPPTYARGSAHVFLDAGAVWDVQARLEAPAGANGELFGSALGLRGNRAVIGSPLASARRGAAHIFERTDATWSHRQQIVASDGLAGDRFGWSVAMGDDVALVGAPYWLEGCGAAYLYRPIAGVWSQTAEANVAAPLPGNLLGWSVAVTGARFGVGAPGYAGAPDHFGAVYWFGDTDPIFASGFEAAPGTRGEEGCFVEG